MPKYVLDTNHLSHAVRKVSHLRDRLRAAVRQGHTLGTCWPALCELEVGIKQTADPDAVHQTLRTVLKDVRIWPTDFRIVHTYAELRLFTKAHGKVLSHVDHILASFAQCMDAILLTSDNDFKAIPTIHTENWLVEP